jgi:DNA polymerase-1
MWEAVKGAFKKAGFGEQEALCQARVARILRSGEYDKKTGNVKLWQS